MFLSRWVFGRRNRDGTVLPQVLAPQVHFSWWEETVRRFVFLLFILVGNASFGLAQSAGVTRIEEKDPSIVYSGDWYISDSPANSGGSAFLTNATGARVVVTFSGTAISWIGVTDQWNGMATVILDGQPRKIDAWSANTRYQAVVYNVSGLPSGVHKLSIEITHERGPNGQGSWVFIDAFDIQNGAGVAGGLPSASGGRIENDNPALTFTGVWYPQTHPIHSGGTALISVDPNSSASLTFTGTGIAWVSYRDEWSGHARVFLDGTLVTTIDGYLSPSQAQTVPYRIDNLAPGNHTLTIVVAGAKNARSGGSWVWLDAFDVIP
jgi:hypothetical protein